MLESPNILVTGATGFVGKNLIPLLSTKYSNIYALVRQTSKIDFLQKYDIKLKFGDLLDKATLKECIKGIDVIIHLGALMSDKDYLPKNEFYKINVLGLKNIIEEAHGKVEQFIHISSVGVYGPTDEFGASEEQPYGRDLSRYEYSKAEAEKAILSLTTKDTFPFTILRLGQLYGPYMYYGWPDIIKSIEEKRMFIIGRGDKLLQLTYVGDAVRGIMLTIGNEKCLNQIFNICGDRAYKVKDIFYTIAQKLNKPYPRSIPLLPIYIVALFLKVMPYRMRKMGRLKYLDLHRLNFFIHHHAYNISKAKDYFGYKPEVPLSSGMDEEIKWYLEFKKRGYQNE